MFSSQQPRIRTCLPAVLAALVAWTILLVTSWEARLPLAAARDEVGPVYPLYLPFVAKGAIRPVMPITVTPVGELWQGHPGGVAWSGDHVVAGLGSRLAVIDPARDGFDMVLGSTEPFTRPIVAVSALGGLAIAASAAGDVATVDVGNPSSPRVLGRLTLSFGGWRIQRYVLAQAADRAYLMTGGPGVAVLDIRRPEAPELVGWVDGLQNVVGMALAENHLYAVEDRTGFEYRVPVKVFRLDSVALPEEVRRIDLPGEWRGLDGGSLALDGSTLALLIGDTLSVFDLAVPTEPVLRDQLEIPLPFGMHAVALSAGYAWVGSQEPAGPLALVDVSDPGSLRLLDTITLPHGAAGLAAKGTGTLLAVSAAMRQDYSGGDYYARGAGVAMVRRFEDQAVPTGSMRLPYHAEHLACAGERCFVTEGPGASTILELDLAEPSAPRPAGSVSVPEILFDIAIDGELVVAIGPSRLFVVDVADAGHPRLASELALGERLRYLTLDGGMAFVTESRTIFGPDPEEGTRELWDLHVVDLGDPRRPRLRSTLPLDVAVPAPPLARGGRVYLVGRGRRAQWPAELVNEPVSLQVLDARSGTEPPIGRLALPMAAWVGALSLDGDNLWASGYLGDGTGYLREAGAGLLRIDVTRPTRPRLVGLGPLGAMPSRILARESIVAAVDCQDRLTLVDVARPGDPLPVGGFPLPLDPESGWSCGDAGGEVGLANGHLVLGLGWDTLKVLRMEPLPDGSEP